MENNSFLPLAMGLESDPTARAWGEIDLAVAQCSCAAAAHLETTEHEIAPCFTTRLPRVFL